MAGRPNRCFWVLTTLLYGRHPWLTRTKRGSLLIRPEAASNEMGIRVDRLRAALKKLCSAGLVTSFHPYKGLWELEVAPPIGFSPSLPPVSTPVDTLNVDSSPT